MDLTGEQDLELEDRRKVIKLNKIERCVCGSYVMKSRLRLHTQTMKHEKYLEADNLDDVEQFNKALKRNNIKL